MDAGFEAAGISDGCTGFWWAEWVVPDFTACCFTHDVGGTDGQLLDCLMTAAPEWSWPLVALAVAAMILFRPVYRLFKAKGTARH